MKLALRERTIFECDPGVMPIALRAAQFLRDRPKHKDAIVAYGEAPNERAFYVKRNKSSISVRELEA